MTRDRCAWALARTAIATTRSYGERETWAALIRLFVRRDVGLPVRSFKTDAIARFAQPRRSHCPRPGDASARVSSRSAAASSCMMATIRGLNQAYAVAKDRAWWKRRLVGFALTLV